MKHELKVPTVGESIQEVQIGQWLKGEGQWADKDESLVEIESDKATVESSAPAAGIVVAGAAPPGRRGAGGHVDRLLGRGPAAGRAPRSRRRPALGSRPPAVPSPLAATPAAAAPAAPPIRAPQPPSPPPAAGSRSGRRAGSLRPRRPTTARTPNWCLPQSRSAAQVSALHGGRRGRRRSCP